MSVFEVILVRMRENVDQNNSEYGHFSRSGKQSFELLYYLLLRQFYKLISVYDPYYILILLIRIFFAKLSLNYIIISVWKDLCGFTIVQILILPEEKLKILTGKYDFPTVLLTINRSSRPEVFCRKGVLKSFTKFTGKHPCQSLFLRNF